MQLSIETVFMWLQGIVGFFGVWFLNRMVQSLDSLREAVSELTKDNAVAKERVESAFEKTSRHEEWLSDHDGRIYTLEAKGGR